MELYYIPSKLRFYYQKCWVFLDVVTYDADNSKSQLQANGSIYYEVHCTCNIRTYAIDDMQSYAPPYNNYGQW